MCVKKKRIYSQVMYTTISYSYNSAYIYVYCTSRKHSNFDYARAHCYRYCHCTCFWWFLETSSIRTRSVALPCSSITSLLSGDSFKISWFCTLCMLSYMRTSLRGTRRLLTSPPEGPSRCTCRRFRAYRVHVTMRRYKHTSAKLHLSVGFDSTTFFDTSCVFQLETTFFAPFVYPLSHRKIDVCLC